MRDEREIAGGGREVIKGGQSGEMLQECWLPGVSTRVGEGVGCLPSGYIVSPAATETSTRRDVPRSFLFTPFLPFPSFLLVADRD